MAQFEKSVLDAFRNQDDINNGLVKWCNELSKHQIKLHRRYKFLILIAAVCTVSNWYQKAEQNKKVDELTKEIDILKGV